MKDIGRFYLQISLEEILDLYSNPDCPRKTFTCITCNHKPQTIYILKENLILYVLV